MRPGTQFQTRTTKPARGAPTDTGVAFVTGLTERGDHTKPIELHNMGDYLAKCGARVNYGILYDWCETVFNEGGTTIMVGRVVGPAPVRAKRTLNDRAGVPLATLDVEAKWVGDYGNNLGVQVIAGVAANSFILVITYNGVEVERSYELNSPTEAVAWGVNATWVRVIDRASVTAAPANNPVVAAVAALAGGTDNRAAVLDAQWDVAQALFTKDLGPGQVVQAGRTTDAAHISLVAHASANNRTAVCDLADTPTAATLKASVDAVRASTADPAWGSSWAPWNVIPGLTRTTRRTVPPSALACGLMARADAASDTNHPAAGEQGQARYVLDVTQQYNDATREDLNSHGVDVIRPVYGGIRAYGYRTMVNADSDPTWESLANQRLRMEIAAKGDAIAERYVFAVLDGQRKTISAYGGDLAALLKGYWVRGSLYGASPDEAFAVDVGPAVNTDITIANGELHAVLAVRMSPFAELVVIELVKVAITESV